MPCHINETRHKLNPLHVYCRLRDIGFNTDTSREVIGVYERYVFRPINNVVSDVYCKKYCKDDKCLDGVI